MARTHFQKLGVWFPRAGKTLLVTPACDQEASKPEEALIPVYLFAAAYLAEGENSVSYFNEENVWPEDTNPTLVAKIEGGYAFQPISDIPEGVLFYLTDSEEGSEPSEEAKEEGRGCYLTWSE